MKIAFDHQIFASQQYGGVSRTHARLAAQLDAAGHDVGVFAPFHINAYLGDMPAGIVRGRRLAATSWRGRFARQASRLLAPPAMAAFRPQIVQETYYAARGLAPRGARTVLMVYDMIHELFPDSVGPDDPAPVLKKAAVARADHVLCISESTRADLVARIPEAAGKSSVVLLGFDAVPPLPPAPRDGRPYLLFVGQREGYKNWAGLLEAYAASSRLRAEFDLLAAGGKPLSAAEREAIARHGLADRVRHQPVDDSALQRCYADAALFVYPSLYEGFGIPPLEAMSAGIPVVAMRASSVPEVCGDAAQWAEPGDPGSLQRAIEAVAFDPARAAALVAAGRERLTLFSWERTAAATAAAYRALL